MDSLLVQPWLGLARLRNLARLDLAPQPNTPIVNEHLLTSNLAHRRICAPPPYPKPPACLPIPPPSSDPWRLMITTTTTTPTTTITTTITTTGVGACALTPLALHCCVLVFRTADLTQARFGFCCAFRDGGGNAAGGSWVGDDGRVWHSHDGLAPHSHEPIYSPGDFTKHAAARLARLHRPRLHRRNWRPRRHGVSSIVSYYFPLLFPTAGSLDHIVQCGYLEAVMERFVSRLLCNPKFLLCTPANFSFIWDFGLFGMEESRVSTSLGIGSSCR